MELSVIMPTLANHEFLLDACRQIILHTHTDFELIVVYNGKAERISEVQNKLSGLGDRILFISAPEHSGVAKSYNLGFYNSKGQYVAFVHDDLLIQDELWFDKLRRVLDKYPEIGFVGGSEPKYVDRSPKEMVVFDANGGTVECDWSPTLSLTRRRHLEEGMLFDEFYLVGLEDIDWALNFRKNGLKVAFSPILHNHIGNIGSYNLFKRDKEFLEYYSKEGVRERYFIQKYKDILKTEYCERVSKRWDRKDRDWRKKWWKELYFKYYLEKVKSILR